MGFTLGFLFVLNCCFLNIWLVSFVPIYCLSLSLSDSLLHHTFCCATASPTAEPPGQHAPATQRKVSSRPPSPWFCAVGPQLLEAKRERRRAERLSLKSRLEVHKQIFPFRLQTRQQNSATRKCIVQHQDLSSKQLFSITNTLLSKSNTSSQPFYSIRTSAAVFVTSLWTKCLPPVSVSVPRPCLYLPSVAQFLMDPHWLPTTLCHNRQYAKCWTRPPSKHANWTLFRRHYWLNSLMTFSRLLLQLMTLFFLCSNPPLSGRCWINLLTLKI